MKQNISLRVKPFARWTAVFCVIGLSSLGRIEALDNLIANGDFEAPEIEAQDSDRNPAGWSPFASGKEGIGTSKMVVHGGKQSARLMVPTDAGKDANQGIFQLIPVTAGKTYTFTVLVRADASDPLKGSVRGQVSIEWKDGSDQKKEIGRNWGLTDWGASLPADKWTEVMVTAKAPSQAKFAAVVVTQFVGPSPQDTSGTFFVDDATVIEK